MINLPIRKSILTGLLAALAGAVFAQAPVRGTQQTTVPIEQRVERIERMMQSQGLLEILQQIQQLQQDVNMLRGEIETHNYNLDQLSRRQRDLYADIDQRLQRLEGGTAAPLDMTTGSTGPDIVESPPLETLSGISGGTESSSSQPASGGLQVEVITNTATEQTAPAGGNTAIIQPSQPLLNDPMGPEQEMLQGQIDISPEGTDQVIASAQPPARPVSTDPVQLQAEYQQAFNLLRQSLYDQAIKAFQQFLTDHPNDRYSDSAQYWLAEAYYVKRDFQPALDEYNKLVTHFPESPKVSDAMLKIGFTLIELGQLDNAREHLQALIRQQPDSTVARLADERLKQLGSAPQQNLPAGSN